MPADDLGQTSGRTAQRRRWLTWLAYGYLFLCFRGLLPLLLSNGNYDELEANVGWKGGVAALQALCSIAIAAHWRTIVACLSLRSAPLLLLIFLPLASCLWSDSPQQSLIGGLGVAITGLFLLVLIEELGHLQIIRICLHLSAFLALLSVIFVAAGPGLMTIEEKVSWRGCFMHKNSLGNRMLVGFLAAVAIAVAEPSRARRNFAIACASVFALLIALSESRTSILGLAVTLALLAVFNPGRLIPLSGVMRIALVILLAAPALIVLLAGTDDLLGLLADNKTLTGRTDLWNDILAVIERRPLLGYGYQGFWSDESLRYQAFGASGWQTGKAHNAVLDHILDAGVLGMAILILLTATVVARWLPSARAYAHGMSPDDRRVFIFSTLFLVSLIPLGFSEVRIILHNDLHFALLISTSACFLAKQRGATVRTP